MNLSKLEKIVKSDKRYYKQDIDDSCSFTAARLKERIQAKFDKIYTQKRAALQVERLNNLPISKASKYAKTGDEYLLRQELLFGHAVNNRDAQSGRTLLLEACGHGHFHIVRMLLNEFKADVSIPTLMGRACPLHLAVEGGYRQIASILITNGADVNCRDGYGRVPLHFVSKVSLMRLLLKYPVDVSIKSVEGLTPLRHYLKYTPEDDHIFDIVSTLSELEEQRSVEVTKMEIERLRMSRLAVMESFHNSTSTVVSSRRELEVRGPW